MRACYIYGAGDLRIGEQELTALEPQQVRVGVRAVGICGSDLHYYHEGRVGNFVIREPFTPGHEASGEVLEVGAAVTNVKPGDRVAINPALPCGQCVFCRGGHENHCTNVRFLGSASRFPHMQGAMRESLVVDARQCLPIPNTLPFTIAAFAEPLSVGLHAVERAGSLLGKTVMVIGCGPIGALTLMAAKQAGARHLVAVDVVAHTLEAAAKVGATRTINAKTQTDALAELARDKGQIDVSFEASGNYQALATCIASTRPAGTIVQVGTLGAGPKEAVPLNDIMVKSLDYRGAFRFGPEYAWAVDFLNRGIIDVSPLLTEAIPVERIQDAFALASDRTKAMKVQVTF